MEEVRLSTITSKWKREAFNKLNNERGIKSGWVINRLMDIYLEDGFDLEKFKKPEKVY